MEKFILPVFLSVIACFVIFFFSLNLHFYLVSQEYYNTLYANQNFEFLDDTCLPRVIIIKKKLDAQGIPAKILLFYVQPPNEKIWGHAIVLSSWDGFLVLHDYNGGIVLCETDKYDLNSNPKDVISLRYKHVLKASYLEHIK